MRFLLFVSVLLILQVNLSFSLPCLYGTVYHWKNGAEKSNWSDKMFMYAKKAGEDEFCSVRFSFDEGCHIGFEPLPVNGNSAENCRIEPDNVNVVCKCGADKCDKAVIEEAHKYASGIEGTDAERCVDIWKNLDFGRIPNYGGLLDRKVQCFRAAYKLSDDGKWEKHELPQENEGNSDLFCAILFKDNGKEVVFTGAIESGFPIAADKEECDLDGNCFCSTNFCNRNLIQSSKHQILTTGSIIPTLEQFYELHLILNPSERTDKTRKEGMTETTSNRFARLKEELKKRETTTTTIAPKEPVGPDPVAPTKPVGRGRRRRPDGVGAKTVVHVFLIVFFSLVF